MNLYEEICANYQKITDSKPVILNLTNSVTQDFIANALLAIGASPIISQDQSEIGELLVIASGININIGTLNPNFNELALKAAKIAQQLKKPIILDPVGAGASVSRTQIALSIAPYATIIRGNASEIMAVSGTVNDTAGVDSRHDTSEALQSGQSLAAKYFNTIVISGKTDWVIASKNIFENHFGNPLMGRVTGMGCVLSAIIAAFAAANENPVLASYFALVFYTLCAEKALTIANTPAKFKMEFIDTLYAPDWEYIKSRLSKV